MTLDEDVTPLKAALERRGMRTWIFARRMGVSPETASRWAAGIQNMSTESVIRAARILRAPELLLDHPVGRELRDWGTQPRVAEPVLIRAYRYPDGRLQVVGGPIAWEPDETPPPAAPVAAAA